MKSIKSFINKFKFLILCLFLILYFTANFFDGNRGYFSYQKKIVELEELTKEENMLKKKNKRLILENKMLSDDLNLDYLDEIYRKLFVVGKKGETLIVIK